PPGHRPGAEQRGFRGDGASVATGWIRPPAADPVAGRYATLRRGVGVGGLTRWRQGADPEVKSRRRAAVQSRGSGISRTLARRALLLVQLDHPHRARGRGLEAEVAQRALVQVLFDDLEGAALRRPEDVDRADLDQLLRQLCIGRDRRVHLHIDEHARHRQCPFSRSFTSAGMSSMRSATEMSAAFMRSILSAVVSALPSTMVPAWPKRMPGLSPMKRPAMKAMMGRRDPCSRTQSDSSASMRPPGSE